MPAASPSQGSMATGNGSANIHFFNSAISPGPATLGALCSILPPNIRLEAYRIRDTKSFDSKEDTKSPPITNPDPISYSSQKLRTKPMPTPKPTTDGREEATRAVIPSSRAETPVPSDPPPPYEYPNPEPEGIPEPFISSHWSIPEPLIPNQWRISDF